MKKSYDFREDWPRIKKELARVSKEALDLAKKGEEQLVKFSRQGKVHVDSTALNLKKEHLLLRIGKEYVRSKMPGKHSDKMEGLLGDLAVINKQTKSLRNKLKASKPSSKGGRVKSKKA